MHAHTHTCTWTLGIPTETHTNHTPLRTNTQDVEDIASTISEVICKGQDTALLQEAASALEHMHEDASHMQSMIASTLAILIDTLGRELDSLQNSLLKVDTQSLLYALALALF